MWDVGLCVDKLQTKVKKKRELRLSIGPEEPVADSAYSSLLFREISLLLLFTASSFLCVFCNVLDQKLFVPVE